MDFSNRNLRSPQNGHGPQYARPAAPEEPAPTVSQDKKKQPREKGGIDWLKLASVVLLFAVTILLVGVIVLIASNGKTKENQFVDTSKYQAVFVNGTNQVFVGKITALSSDYIRLNDVYNITVNQNTTDQKSSVTITKQGCQLHAPEDEVVLNQQQISFWENLKSDGQVVAAIQKYKTDNNGQLKCDTPAASDTSSTSSSTSTTSTPSAVTSTPSTSTTTTTKK